MLFVLYVNTYIFSNMYFVFNEKLEIFSFFEYQFNLVLEHVDSFVSGNLFDFNQHMVFDC